MGRYLVAIYYSGVYSIKELHIETGVSMQF